MKKLKIILPLIIVLFSVFLYSCQKQNKQIVFTNIWARPGLIDGNSAVFLDIANPTGLNDRLIDVESEVSFATEIHQTKMIEGVMQMERQMYVEIPADGEVVLKPGDLHIMLIGLKEDLSPNDEFNLNLKFEKNGEFKIRVIVKAP